MTFVIFSKSLAERTQTYVVSLITIVMLAAVVQYLAQAFSAVTVPFALLRIEAFVLDGVMRIVEHSRLYLPTAEAPTTQHVYNFFTYAVPAWLAAPIGTNPEALLIAGRCLSLATSLGLSVLLGWWAFRISSSPLAMMFTALMPFYFYEFALPMFFQLRPESPATLCSAAAIIYLLISSQQKTSSAKPIIIAALLCFIAFLFKQSFIAAPVAIAMCFLLCRQWREFILFSATYGGAIAVFFGLMYATVGRAYFENTIFVMRGIEVHTLEALKVYSTYFFANSFGLLLALPAALWLAARRYKQNALVLCYWGVATVWSLYSAGKVGSGTNYFADFGVASILLITQTIFSVNTKSNTTSLAKSLVVLPLLIQILAGAIADFAPNKPGISRNEPNVDLTPYLMRYQTNQGKLIFHEKIAIQLGNPFGYDWYLLDILARQDRYDPYILSRQIYAGEFDTIVFSQRPYSSIEPWLVQVADHAQNYERFYEDNVVLEFRRLPDQERQK